MTKNDTLFITISSLCLKWRHFVLFLLLAAGNPAKAHLDGLKMIDVSKKLSSINKEEYDANFFNNGDIVESSMGNSEKQKAVQTINIISQALKTKMKVADSKSDRIATLIAFSARKYDIDPRIMIAILKVESSFNQSAHNSFSCIRAKKKNKNLKHCGDYSIAQINYEVWSKAFVKRGLKPLDIERLKVDDSYAIFRMGEILSLLKKDFKKDPYWFALYHSGTPSLKNKYKKKVLAEFEKVKVLPSNLLDAFPRSSHQLSLN